MKHKIHVNQKLGMARVNVIGELKPQNIDSAFEIIGVFCCKFRFLKVIARDFFETRVRLEPG